MSFRSYIFSKAEAVVPPEILSQTLIEGIGTTTTPAALATRLGIQEANISDFRLSSNGITCTIAQNYNVPTSFPDVAFKDIDGRAQSVGSQLRRPIQIFYSPSLSNLSQRCFYGTGKLKYCVIPNVSTVEPNSYGHFIFNIDPATGVNNLNGLTVCFPAAWATSNAGAPHPEAQYVIDNGGAVSFGDVENYQFLISKPVKPKNITVTNVTGTVVEFSFTGSQASVNPILRYELYVDGVYKRVVKTSDAVAFDSTNTQYEIKIEAVDIYYNRSQFSDPVLVNTLAEPYPGLNSVYELQDETAGVIVDSYRGNNGIITGTYTLGTAEGKVKPKAIYLGDKGSIQTPNGGITRKASVNFWLRKANNNSTDQSGFIRTSGTGPQGHYRYSNGNLYSECFSDTRKTMGAGLISDITAEMQMVTITADQDLNQWKFYQNAALYWSGTVGNLAGTIWDVFEIGTSGTQVISPGANLDFGGWLEQLLYFHKALTQAEIDYWYNGGLGRAPIL